MLVGTGFKRWQVMVGNDDACSSPTADRDAPRQLDLR